MRMRGERGKGRRYRGQDVVIKSVGGHGTGRKEIMIFGGMTLEFYETGDTSEGRGNK